MTVRLGLAVLNVLVVVGSPAATTLTVYFVPNLSLPVDVQLCPSAASFPATVADPPVTVTDVTVAEPVALTTTGVEGATFLAFDAGTIARCGGPDVSPGDWGAPEVGPAFHAGAADVQPVSRNAAVMASAARVAGTSRVRLVMKFLAYPGVGVCCCG